MAKLLLLSAAFLLGTSRAFQSPTSRPRSTHRVFLPSLLAENSSSINGPINENIWDIAPPIRIEGNSLKTWAFPSGTSKRVQVSIQSVGRPIEASVELWQTPSYTPTKFTVECEDASENIVHSIIELPEGHPVTLAVYNTEGIVSFVIYKSIFHLYIILSNV